MNLITFAEKAFVPDLVIRIGIRSLLSKRLKSTTSGETSDFAKRLRGTPLALATDAANQQHYEVPPAFFEKVLGPRLKYSSCLFTSAEAPLPDAEDEMLRATCLRAEIQDGMRILELGCGWGSLTLLLAEQFPTSRITAISNSHSQRLFITDRASERGLENVQVITADMREFTTSEKFDRVVSIEMFEHMRNYELLFRRVSDWMKPEGKAFVHVFCHRETPYLFEAEGADDWMGRHFFTGGMMPSEDLFSHFAADLVIQQQWRVSGLHYWRTCEAWLRNLDRNRAAVLECFREGLSDRQAALTLQRWRIFFMACAELFRYRGGEEWFVGHYLFQQAPAKRLQSIHHASCDAASLTEVTT